VLYPARHDEELAAPPPGRHNAARLRSRGLRPGHHKPASIRSRKVLSSALSCWRWPSASTTSATRSPVTSSQDAGPADLLPSHGPYDPLRAFDAPLRRRSEVSSHARGLLRGASAPTATGLAPASSVQHEPPIPAVRSGRTMEDCNTPPTSRSSSSSTPMNS
jgi:hypothetical protein